MQRCQEGFLLIEILLSFLIVTLSVVVCMRYRVGLTGWYMQALTTMDVVNQLEAKLDAYEHADHAQVVLGTDGIIVFSKTVMPVAIPCVYGAPPGFSLACARSMYVMTLCATWTGLSGVQQCSMPLVFKKEDDE